jgi:hypothetical protein
VEAWGNVQICNYQESDDRLKISGNARIVYIPKTIKEFMDFYGTRYDIDSEKATFFKAVHKRNGQYFSSFDPSFEYIIGETISNSCDPNVDDDCSFGIHIAHKDWALSFGSDWSDLAILEVETAVSGIVLPKHSNGKVRTPEVKVIREVPLSECGLYGKILAKKMEAKKHD